MEFRSDGTLLYCVEADSKWQIMRLVFRVEGNFIVTDQPSQPSEERTGFTLSDTGALVLDYSGLKAEFSRGSKRCPAV
jgi:hypothetical protein